MKNNGVVVWIQKFFQKASLEQIRVCFSPSQAVLSLPTKNIKSTKNLFPTL